MGRSGELLRVVVWLALAFAALRLRNVAVGRALFALVNIAGLTLLWHATPDASPMLAIGRTAVYLAIVLVHFLLVRRMAAAGGQKSLPAALYPIVVLIAFKYSEPLWAPVVTASGIPVGAMRAHLSVTFIGLSYMAFRLSHLAVEVRSGAARMPTLAEYLGFAFFVPTVPVGPINPASVHLASLDALREGDRARTPIGRSLLRMLVGATKYLFLAGALAHLTWPDLYLDGHPHDGPLDLIVSAVAYYLYLYCNFSGFCDIVIGAAGLLGISVVENFDNPLAARNIKEFWARWHMSLSAYVREMIFSPLSKWLATRWGGDKVNHAIAVALFITFVVTGVWHGAGLNFLLFGVLHASAMVIHHYYLLWLKKRLPRDRFRAYNASFAVRAAATALTFAFVTGTFVVFANDLKSLRAIVHVSPALPERLFMDL